MSAQFNETHVPVQLIVQYKYSVYVLYYLSQIL